MGGCAQLLAQIAQCALEVVLQAVEVFIEVSFWGLLRECGDAYKQYRHENDAENQKNKHDNFHRKSGSFLRM